jgi:hypothetical protein
MTANMGYNDWEGNAFYMRVWCNDSGGVTNRTTFNITTIESTAPTVTISSPVTDTDYQNVVQSLTWTVDDNCDPSMSCKQAIWDGGRNISDSYTMADGGSRTESITWIKGRSYDVIVACTDEASNEGTTISSFEFTDGGVTWTPGDGFCDVWNGEHNYASPDCPSGGGTSGSTGIPLGYIIIGCAIVGLIVIVILSSGKTKRKRKRKRKK